MTLSWTRLQAGAPTGEVEVEVEGWLLPPQADLPPGYGLLVPEAACCIGCPPDPAQTIELMAMQPLPRRLAHLRLRGQLRRLPDDDAAGWRWQLREATVLRQSSPGPWLSRRALLAAAPLACVATAACAQIEASPAAAALVQQGVAMDLHSHAGRVIISRARLRPLEPVAAPMREGGMRLIALAMVADTPVTTVTPDNRIEAMREPEPGELRAHATGAFERLAELVRREGLAVVTTRAELAALRQPGVLVAAEGADFLDNDIARLEPLFTQQRLRHLQLVHYRVNALGDIQTAPPVHGGLTAFGAEVIRACNRLGIVVDVAHGTFELVRRAAEVTQKPLVLSHTSLTANPRPRTRLITRDHARLVASTGGVIGIWPPGTIFPSFEAYAAGVARMADVVGVDHVGIGTDMLGLLSPAIFGDYRQTPLVAEALLRQGFSPADAAKLLGGNYARVLNAVLPA